MLRVTRREPPGTVIIRVIGQSPRSGCGSVRRHVVRQESRKLHTIGANACDTPGREQFAEKRWALGGHCHLKHGVNAMVF